MLSQSQGRGYPTTESRAAARNAGFSALTCTHTPRGQHDLAGVELLALDSWTPSIFDDCPMCGKAPVEPVRVEGQLACRACTSACTICGWACVPGDEACSECVRHLGLAQLAVST